MSINPGVYAQVYALRDDFKDLEDYFEQSLNLVPPKREVKLFSDNSRNLKAKHQANLRTEMFYHSNLIHALILNQKISILQMKISEVSEDKKISSQLKKLLMQSLNNESAFLAKVKRDLQYHWPAKEIATINKSFALKENAQERLTYVNILHNLEASGVMYDVLENFRGYQLALQRGKKPEIIPELHPDSSEKVPTSVISKLKYDLKNTIQDIVKILKLEKPNANMVKDLLDKVKKPEDFNRYVKHAADYDLAGNERLQQCLAFYKKWTIDPGINAEAFKMAFEPKAQKVQQARPPLPATPPPKWGKIETKLAQENKEKYDRQQMSAAPFTAYTISPKAKALYQKHLQAQNKQAKTQTTGKSKPSDKFDAKAQNDKSSPKSTTPRKK